VITLACRRWCTSNKLQVTTPPLNHLDVGLPAKASQVASSAHPELDVKAAYIKLFIMFLASELYYASTSGDEELCIANACIYHLAQFISVLSQSSMWLSEPQADLAMHHGLSFLYVYRSLAARAIKLEQRRYKLRPKLHYLHHTILELPITRQNHFFATCFLDEDFMGKVKALASKCHRTTVVVRCMQRYLMLLGVRWIALRKHTGFGARRA